MVYYYHDENIVKWSSIVFEIRAYLQLKSELRSRTQFAIQNLEFIFGARNFQGQPLVVFHYHCENMMM